MNTYQQNKLPDTRTDAYIDRPLPARPAPPWLYFLGAVLVAAVIVAKISLFLAVVVASFAVLGSRYVHYRVRKGDASWAWANVWRPAPLPAPAWQVFAHSLLKAPTPEGFKDKCRLFRVEASPAGWHLWVEGEGERLSADTKAFARAFNAPWLAIESLEARGIVWVHPGTTALPEVSAARNVLFTAGLTDASYGIIEMRHGTHETPRWTFTVESSALTLTMLKEHEDGLRSATKRFRSLIISEVVPGKYQLDFQLGTPQSPLDQTLPSPHGKK